MASDDSISITAFPAIEKSMAANRRSTVPEFRIRPMNFAISNPRKDALRMKIEMMPALIAAAFSFEDNNDRGITVMFLRSAITVPAS
jgi:hypothetical protein